MTASDQTGVVITLSEIYAEVRSLGQTVGKVDTTLTAFRDEVCARLDDHETRIRADEAARWPLPTVGVCAAVIGAVAALGALFLTR